MNDEIINELYFNTDELMKNLFSKYLNGKEVFKDVEYKTKEPPHKLKPIISDLFWTTIIQKR